MDYLSSTLEPLLGRLLDLGRDNPLLNFRLDTPAALRIDRPLTFQVWDDLVIGGRSLRFDEAPWIPTFPGHDATTRDGGLEEGDSTGGQPRLAIVDRSAGDLRNTLALLEDAHRLALREEGAPSVYLCFGFLKWRGLDQFSPILSPLVLVAANIKRDGSGRHFLEASDEAPVINPTLVYRLRTELGVSLPRFEPGMDLGEAFDAIDQAIASSSMDQRSWSIDPMCAVGVMPCRRTALFSDILRKQRQFLDHPIAYQALGMEMPSISGRSHSRVPSPAIVSNPNDPVDPLLVFDADASQVRAISNVQAGNSLRVDLPPGSAHGELVANLIANALYEGKKVLYVSKRLASLEDVRDRLEEALLDDFSLVITAEKGACKDAIAQLSRSVELSAEEVEPATSSERATFDRVLEFEQTCERLDEQTDALYTVVEGSGLTQYELYGRLAGLANLDGLADLALDFDVAVPDHVELDQDLEALRNLAQARVAFGRQPLLSPWYGSVVGDVVKEDVQSVSTSLIRLSAELADVEDSCRRFSLEHGVPVEPSVHNAQALVRLVDAAASGPSLPPGWLFERDLDEIESLRTERLHDEKRVEERTRHFFQRLQRTQAEDEALVAPGLPETADAPLDVDAARTIIRARLESDSLYSAWEKMEPARERQAYNQLVEYLSARDTLRETLFADYDPKVLDLDVDWLESVFKGGGKRPKAKRRTRRGNEGDSGGGYGAAMRMLSELRLDAGHADSSFSTSDGECGSTSRAIAGSSDQDGQLSSSGGLDEIVSGSFQKSPTSPDAISGGEWDSLQSEGQERRLTRAEALDCVQLLRRHETVARGLAKHRDELRSVYGSAYAGMSTDLAALDRHRSAYRHMGELLGLLDEIQELSKKLGEQDERLSEAFGYLYRGIGTSWESEVVAALAQARILRGQANAIGIDSNEYLEKVACGGDRGARAAVAGLDEAYRRCLTDHVWLASLYENPDRIFSASISDLRAHIIECIRHLGEVGPWARYRESRNACVQRGLGAYVDAVEARDVPAELVAPLYEWRYLVSLLPDEVVSSGSDARETFVRGVDAIRVETVRDVSRTEEEFRIATRSRIRRRLLNSLPTMSTASSEWFSDDRDTLRDMLHPNSRRTLRDIMGRVPSLILRLRPCMMMSPIAVATYLKHESYLFDIAIIDDAQATPLEESLPTIMRAGQIVVLDNGGGMPAHNRMSRMLSMARHLRSGMARRSKFGREPQARTAVEASPKSTAESLGFLRHVDIRWCPDLRNPYLLRFANACLPQQRLYAPPVASMKCQGMVRHLMVTSASFDTARRNNVTEARAVAGMACEWLKSHRQTDSLGIVTLTMTQARCVSDELESAAMTDPEVWCAYLEARASGRLLVDVADSCQGTMLDDVILCVGFAPDESGVLPSDFGPVMRPGGERMVRAIALMCRHDLTIVSSIKASDLPVGSRLGQALGLRLLKRLMELASVSGSQQENLGSAQDAPAEDAKSRDGGGRSSFARAVRGVLESAGHQVAYASATTHSLVDLIVFDGPERGNAVLGIVLDGERDSQTWNAREYARLLPEAHRGKGWRLLRLWSQAWIVDPIGQRERLLQIADIARAGGSGWLDADGEQLPIPQADREDSPQDDALGIPAGDLSDTASRAKGRGSKALARHRGWGITPLSRHPGDPRWSCRP